MGQIVASAGSSFWVYLPGYILAFPAAVIAAQQWRRARRAEKEHKAAAEAAAEAAQVAEERRQLQQEVSDMVAASLRALVGTDNPAEIHATTPANPSIRDSLLQALEETATLTSEVAIIHRALELHLAEPHGGTVPEWMMRAISAQQRTQGQR